MKYKIIITIILFIFSFLLIKSGSYFIKENDNLMKILKEKQTIYNKNPIDAIITEQAMIPGISGRKINLEKSYQKMKSINEFRESLLVFDEIKPSKTIDGLYNKIIISGNPRLKKVSLITNLNDNYCYTQELSIKKECIQDNKYTILIHKISSLSDIKELSLNGKVFYLDNNNELSIIRKYLKNNNYECITIDELLFNYNS